ncbi:DUF2158 domain-containing protein [Acinetobacter soli]|uniref:YodC family protein n=1 Tax=Acinetobacter soli TaxID=487316 RepID=UPI00280E4EE5|nr:DUF2158 domain-containing protein [Acinetobacter soli]MDQ8996363.1 DUF2158 domain-containing protein [Acinetobacter soli]
MSIKAGDVVQLNSGGYAMTVEYITDRGAFCLWFVEGDIKSYLFKLDALSLVQKD